MLGKLTSRFVVAGASAAVLCAVSAAPAWAAKPAAGATASSTSGIDVSSPQCGASLPKGQAFAIVGVNGGLANDYNDCLRDQWNYATTLVPTTTQLPAQAYLNTGDAGNTVADWPSPNQPGGYVGASTATVNGDGSYGTPSGNCAFASSTGGRGANSAGCAYVYGYDMVAGMNYTDDSGAPQTILGDLKAFSAATGSATATGAQLYQQPVWLDVETGNSWQPATTAGYAMNIADLQGMVAAIKDAGGTGTAPIGIYSTAAQWKQITGLTGASGAGTLAGLPVWIPGARSQKAATSNCGQTPFTGAPKVSVTQWFANPYDADHSCT